MKVRWMAGFALLAPVLLLGRTLQSPARGTAAGARAEQPAAPAQAQTATSAQVPAGPTPSERLEVPPPPFSEDVFPCSFCHVDLKTNPKRRFIEDHEDIVLKHDEKNRWCLDCHDSADRDVLHLASGEKVPFEESYRVCGQCHGEKYRDWRAGVHGRRTGQWNGEKRYLLCVHCHSPHQPQFKPMKPLAAPLRTERPR